MPRLVHTKKLCPRPLDAIPCDHYTSVAILSPPLMTRLLIICLVALLAGCGSGLQPPDEPGFGSISVRITYEGTWPVADSLRDLRFVALRFVPRDTTDLLQLNRMVISPGLQRNVESDAVTLTGVPEGFYPYAGVAQQFTAALFDWRPVGLVDGVFEVRPDATTEVFVAVDFGQLPVFPPPVGGTAP